MKEEKRLIVRCRVGHGCEVTKLQVSESENEGQGKSKVWPTKRKISAPKWFQKHFQVS